MVDYFIKSTYLDSKNESRPCYNVTKLGCDFLANKFTGEKGIIFTARYVRRFNEIEQILKEQLKCSYMIEDPIERAKRWIEEQEENQFLIKKKDNIIQLQQPKVEKWERFLNNEGLTTIEDFSKTLAIKGYGRNNMYKLLREMEYLKKDNSPYTRYVEQGLFIRKPSGTHIEKGELIEDYKTFLTSKGIDKIMEKLLKIGVIKQTNTISCEEQKQLSILS
ncbi:DNA-binding protein [Clostridioides difficile]|nr:DNA-binding protein [Clostridioides difficile]MDB2994428.1 DNA-binding protein [Clostridioides difficile]MDB3030985.1 DNA-binding protein [Clostridioides difficile]MDB3059497.1 DNA-binding protein [Clostridioides difficile]MDB3361683.1 DNA-binding protein [Clostridioides difficile]